MEVTLVTQRTDLTNNRTYFFVNKIMSFPIRIVPLKRRKSKSFLYGTSTYGKIQ